MTAQTMEMVPFTPGMSIERVATLDELAATANREYRLANASATTAVGHAIACGEALLAARKRIPMGEWQMWCAGNVSEMSKTCIARYCRLARHKHEFSVGEYATIAGAVDYLAQLSPPSPLKGVLDPRMKLDVDEARRLRRQGMSYASIAEILGVSYSTVRLHLIPSERQKHREKIQRHRDMIRAARLAARAKIRDDAVRRRGGLPAEAYAALRRCALIVDQAMRGVDDASERSRLAAALGFVHKAEDEIVRALRIERTL